MFTTVSDVNVHQLSPSFLKQILNDSINALYENIDQYCAHPGKDFTRPNSKLGLLALFGICSAQELKITEVKLMIVFR